MSDPHLFDRRKGGQPGPMRPAAAPGPPPAPDEELPPISAEFLDPPEEPDLLMSSSADRRNVTTRSKLAEGARGIKLAIRSESGFFAHAYRGLLIAISAAILGVSPIGWCFLVVSAALVLIAETFRCAIDTVLDAIGEPDDPRLRAAREIATGGLLFASITSAVLTIMVLSLTLGEQLGW